MNNDVPLKPKTVWGNNVSFMNKDWRKTIYERTRLKNIYNKKRSRENQKQPFADVFQNRCT